MALSDGIIESEPRRGERTQVLSQTSARVAQFRDVRASLGGRCTKEEQALSDAANAGLRAERGGVVEIGLHMGGGELPPIRWGARC